MLADGMTKGKMRHMIEEFLRNPSWKLVDDEKFQSFKKRKADGSDAFDKQEDAAGLATESEGSQSGSSSDEPATQKKQRKPRKRLNPELSIWDKVEIFMDRAFADHRVRGIS